MRKNIYWLRILTLIGVLGNGCGQETTTSGSKHNTQISDIKEKPKPAEPQAPMKVENPRDDAL